MIPTKRDSREQAGDNVAGTAKRVSREQARDNAACTAKRVTMCMQRWADKHGIRLVF